MSTQHLKTCDKNVDCPFFKGHNANEIRCEGILGDEDSNMRIMYDDEKVKRETKKFYCNNFYKRCTWYMCLMRNKYGD